MRKLLVTLLFLPVTLLAYTSPGKPSGFVNDFAHLLKPETVTTLNQTLQNFSTQTGNEISVVTVPNLGGDTIENYAQALFKEWGIGKAKQDNGILLLVAKDERQVRIEVGYGLEPTITDIESAHIISEVITPAFKSGEYDTGVTGAVSRLMDDITNGVPLDSTPSGNSFNFGVLSHLFYFGIFFLVFASSILGRSKSWWAGGVVGGVIGLLVLMFMGMVIGIIAIIILIPFGLILDFLASRAYQKHKDGGPRPPWFLGGGFGGGGGMGGGGFGGFGGGSSGGGGASGSF